uniref:ABC1 family protein n=1 Tax=Arundo donax TaxID=35708 RepID=A0A0A9G046_ARUDO
MTKDNEISRPFKKRQMEQEGGSPF